MNGIRSATFTAGLVALAVLGAGCGSSAKTTGTTAPSTASPTVSSSGPSAAEVTAQVTRVWTGFFAGTTPAAAKVRLLQNGAAFAALIAAQAGSPTARATTVQVTKVTPTSPDQATVSYNILINKQVALPNQYGTAVRVGGQWKVASGSFCRLLALEGTAPAACTATASPSTTK